MMQSYSTPERARVPPHKLSNFQRDPAEEAQIKTIVQEAAEKIGGRYNETFSGTPRVIVELPHGNASIVFVNRAKSWKVFFPFPAEKQSRWYFATLEDLLVFLRKEILEPCLTKS